MNVATRFKGGAILFAIALLFGCTRERVTPGSTTPTANSQELLLFFDPTIYKVGEDSLVDRTIGSVQKFIANAPLSTRIAVYVLAPQLTWPSREFDLPYSGLINADTLRLKNAVADTIATMLKTSWSAAHEASQINERRSCIMSAFRNASKRSPSTDSTRGRMRMLLVTDLLESCNHAGNANLEGTLDDTSKIDLSILKAVDLKDILFIHVMVVGNPAISTILQAQALEQYWHLAISQTTFKRNPPQFRDNPPSAAFWADSVKN